ncbi:MAG: hypothetical protein V1668_04755 [Patescibacteria group bacterium]
MQKMIDTKDQRGITTFWGISIILMVVTVVVFVFYILYFFWIENPVPTSEIFIIRAVKHQSVSIPSSVNATGWQAFENGSYRISFKYPGTLTVHEDEITYGTTAGNMLSLLQDTVEEFNLRIFPVKADETVAIAFERITGIDPSAYQSFTEKLGGEEAAVYRQQPGTSQNDRIYFIHAGYIFEAPYNASTVNILSTFKLL